MSSERATAADLVRAFHNGNAISERTLERALGISSSAEGRSNDLPALLHRYGNQNFTFGKLSFRDLREVFRVIKPRPTDLFCDAGAGYGHAVFYGACVADCRFRAVEILPVRCKAMRKAAQRIGLDIEIVEGDALAQNYADVSYIFVNSPFFPATAEKFADRLMVSRKRSLTVIASHNIVDTFRADKRFTEIDVDADLPNYRFGVFRWNRKTRRT
jgi:hypothetical protein